MSLAVAIFCLLIALGMALLVVLVRRIQRRRWRIPAIVAAIVALVPGGFIAGAVSEHLANSWRLARFADQLYDYPLPQGARVVARSKEVGLFGNGDHCDFRVHQEIVTELSLAAVEEHYAALRLRPAVGAGRSDGEPVIDVEATGPGRYTVTAMDDGYYGMLDIRCT